MKTSTTLVLKSKRNPLKHQGFLSPSPVFLSPVASERRDAFRLKVVLRNGGCSGLFGGRSDSPHRGIPQQHIMRLWWNQSLASCGWWLVGDPSVPSRPSIRPHVPTCICTSEERAFVSVRALLRQRRRSSTVIETTALRRSSSTHHYPAAPRRGV